MAVSWSLIFNLKLKKKVIQTVENDCGIIKSSNAPNRSIYYLLEQTNICQHIRSVIIIIIFSLVSTNISRLFQNAKNPPDSPTDYLISLSALRHMIHSKKKENVIAA